MAVSKCAALAVLAFVAPSASAQHTSGKTEVNDPAHIERLNSVPGSSWKAGVNKFFAGMTFDDARVFLGTALNPHEHHATLEDSVYEAIGNDTLPSDFDARTQWPGLIHPIRNQLQCGSCWAFSAAEVLSDRVAIATKRASPVLSPEDLVSCETADAGCGGGQLPNAWKYLQKTGIVTDSCFPYLAGNGTAPACATKCADGKSFTRTKVSSAYAIKGAVNMQKDIMTNGPIQVAFLVYKSFMAYSSGVYQKHIYELLPEGGHAVKVLGWGVEEGTPYWLVANSWDTTWGEKGFFKIVRGKNACGIEAQGPPYGGIPAKADDAEHTDEVLIL
eukprot:CAMPEP_0115103546 /NCGR_PEP_ID=MMETSP0227-20121206/34677_1 /TAXON_ID=89957 /ORGANISM="Polarella glacialis, Strain CCMP 1383" /LENGTH=330 /DNA_ID=CAMNT_0002500079 /DNA_START=36 /DNA_END=1028 /DNA_ORIENTATION=+